MKLRPKNRSWEDTVWRLVFGYGFWFMFAFCALLFVLFATGVFAHEKLGLSSLFGRILVGYVALCMALLGSIAARVAYGEFREWHTRRSIWALLFPSLFGGLLLSGSVWIFWRIFVS